MYFPCWNNKCYNRIRSICEDPKQNFTLIKSITFHEKTLACKELILITTAQYFQSEESSSDDLSKFLTRIRCSISSGSE